MRPKALNEKNSLIQLFRCYRSKKTNQVGKSHTKFGDKSIEKNIVEPLTKAKPVSLKAEVGFEAFAVNPLTNSKVHRDVLWSKQPCRPATRSRPRNNIYEDKRHRSLLNKSDYR